VIEKIQQIALQLQAVYPADEAKEMAWWIAEETTGLTRSQILSGCKGTKNIPNVQTIIERLLHFEPIQYIFGHTLWCGLDLKVSPATLIPRPETAELVDTIYNSQFTIYNSQFTIHNCRVLDVGTGSGCIAIAIKKKHPEWDVTGIDISEEAIAVAKENATRNEADVRFEVIDIFSDEIERIGTFDIVVSNPPYICEKEKAGMRKNVLDFEPETALFVPDDDPLKFYRRIASLQVGKQLYFEINEAYPQELAALLAELGYTEIHIHNDIYGKARIIEGRMA
jgi:release factor glutamine methyltransferase